MAIAGINVFTDYESKSSHKRLSLTKPSVLLMAWFLISVATFLPSCSVLSELVEPMALCTVKTKLQPQNHSADI
jgi:hypothetical protein